MANPACNIDARSADRRIARLFSSKLRSAKTMWANLAKPASRIFLPPEAVIKTRTILRFMPSMRKSDKHNSEHF
ncbi:hypothetical protein XH83_36720 (plasmid) [Bradyrhizobium sp. CCBAU 53351]|uniref:Uncharacterized protein n=2 Tax=Bradyrhizobium TaxID=374 RepID=A0AAE6CCW9_9BRAD|nr:hypothetical protein X265_39290 [Bradyrhizobium guangdongense]QAU51144.1 hypothetical protein XH91_38490 [Bradyrhizobium guangzhouense]QOZ49270.1 hypothetical protein XH89_37770 [Bradyrhizobium sp. CCBAU 53340]QOZ57075.1 hypothetical protein XH90_38210 [Bradyrhizobium sp. CCBAU 53338]QOZ81031.1 hypothetical protein XH83_36720 [Bradyrhizobium sp. CCBAU 53351]